MFPRYGLLIKNLRIWSVVMDKESEDVKIYLSSMFITPYIRPGTFYADGRL